MAGIGWNKERAIQFIERIEHYLHQGFSPVGEGTAGGKGALRCAGDEWGINRNSHGSALIAAVKAAGREPDWSLSPAPTRRTAEPAPSAQGPGNFEIALQRLRKTPLSLDEIAKLASSSRGAALDWIEAQERVGVSVQRQGERYSIAAIQTPSFISGPLEYVSREDNTFLFGAVSDSHLGSKYERCDVLNDLYDRFERAAVDRVFHAGNWIDGEAPFNRFDLHTHGMDAQLRYLAQAYPKRGGIKTYAVAGDDHEGWYAQRGGVNIGKMAENAMRDAGRDDWVDCGYMESHFKLVNANTGKSSILALVHPGGGSSYALSYSIQKIIESLDGGEKPAVGLYGHYHKLWAGNIRNVWCLQTGCTEDQTPFMRKKKLEAHVGGSLVRLEQDPESGAIIGFTPTMWRYFNKSYYNNRWSLSGSVTLPAREIMA